MGSSRKGFFDWSRLWDEKWFELSRPCRITGLSIPSIPWKNSCWTCIPCWTSTRLGFNTNCMVDSCCCGWKCGNSSFRWKFGLTPNGGGGISLRTDSTSTKCLYQPNQILIYYLSIWITTIAMNRFQKLITFHFFMIFFLKKNLKDDANMHIQLTWIVPAVPSTQPTEWDRFQCFDLIVRSFPRFFLPQW